MGRVGVLLLNLGGPDQLKDVRPFLFNLFSDPEIIRLPFPWLQKPLAWLISTKRAKISQENYKQIGGGSPLRKITDAQAQALQEHLQTKGQEVSVYVGMRYWHPFTEEAIATIKADGIER
ncbi:MAG: ferrochelatase, partial [Moorea sp. SIO3E2]|nr:ferrochelatase [Moorena sp. SIO3E2]